MKTALTLFFTTAICFTSLAQIAPTEANLRSAVAAGGIIRFSGSGVIPITAPIAVTTDTVIDGSGVAVILDGKSATNILTVASGVHLSLTNLTFANGAALMPAHSTGGFAPPAKGGAIQNHSGVVVAVDCVFSNNLARGADPDPSLLAAQGGSALGGAIWQDGGSLTIQGGSFIKNRSTGGRTTDPVLSRGGAIYVQAGIVDITNVTFSGNSVDAAPTASFYSGKAASSGGALAVQSGTLEVFSSRFSGNTALGAAEAGRGGAIAVFGGAANVYNAHFLSNSAAAGLVGRGTTVGYTSDGGGLYNGTNANLTLWGCTFESCVAFGAFGDHSPFYREIGKARGGAIFNSGAVSVINATLYGNAASLIYAPEATFGGAIYNEGSFGITNATIANNSSSQPILFGASGTLVLRNSLLAANNGVTATNIFDAGHNLSATSSPAFTSASSHDNLDLRLGPLGNYGGDTPTIPLLAGSPAIDAADDTVSPATDQRGHWRPYGAHADVGAFESEAQFQNVAVNGGSQQIIFAFRAAGGETWRFDSSSDLAQWTPVKTNTFTTDSVVSMPVANASAAIFFRAVRQ
jgi:hypothetical protein